MDFDNESNDKSDFNQNKAVTLRLHDIHVALHNSRFIKKNPEIYYQCLVSLFIELVRAIKKPKNQNRVDTELFKVHIDLWEKAKNMLYELNELQKKNMPIPVSNWEIFYYWEVRLNDLEQDAGLGITFSDDAMNALK